MRRVALSSVVAMWCVLMAGVAFAQPAEVAETPLIDVIKVEGAIDGPLLGFLQERLDRAVADGAVVVLQLDSAGALGQDAVALADRIAGLPVPVITWVGTVPARASGAGMLLLYASSLAAVAPGSQTGPLSPVDLLHPDSEPAGLDAAIDGWLASRGRTVDRSAEEQALTAQDALDLGIADVASPSVLDLLAAIDGQEVMTSGGPVILQTKIATSEDEVIAGGGVVVRFNEPGPVKRVQHGVASPSMILFLLCFGLAALAFEMTQPGFGFAGFSGLALVLLAAYGVLVVPPSWLGMGLLIGGVALLVLDVRRRQLGVLTGLGMLAFLAGSILVYADVGDAIRISPWLIGGLTVATLLYYGFGLTIAIQSRDRILSAQRGLIGLVGEARGRLAPDGPVFVKGALWRGRSLGEPIDSGARVRVRGVEGLILKVDHEPGDAATGDALGVDPDPLPAND